MPLQHLHLNNNGLGPHAGILVADALSKLHAEKEAARSKGQDVPDLETVICGRNRLENGSMTAWARTFSLHNKVKEVKMIQNGIRKEGISHLLTEGLNCALELRVLDIQDNTLTLMGAQALADVVPVWSHIQELGISDSLLSAKGGILLSEALAKGKNGKLEILRLQYNDITAHGLRGLANAAKEALPALKKMEVNGNKFAEEDDAVVTLQEMFEARKEQFGGDIVDEEEWGLDDLDDLEEEDDEDQEEEEAEGEPAPEERAEKLVKEAEEAQEEPVVQLADSDVDALAKRLGETKI